MSKIAAFFDIDGTPYREGLITELFKKVIRYELIDKKVWKNSVELCLWRYNWRFNNVSVCRKSICH